jgi:AAA domain
MTARVQPNDAMRLVLRRLRSYELRPEQVDSGPHWSSACPTEGHLGPRVRWDQHTDGTVTVHACTKGCDGAAVLDGLTLDDKRIKAHSPNGHDPFTKPGRPRGQRTPGDALEIYEKLRAALDDGYDDGRGRTGRYQCPACGAKGDGHGLKVDYDPNRSRRILLLCFQGCSVEEILEPLGMTPAELCADDDTDDLGEDEEAIPSPMGEETAEEGLSRLGTPLARSELASLPKVETLIPDVLSTPAAVVLVGGYGLGKTVLTHSWGCSIATGQSWLGKPVTQRRVLFVVGEGAYGLDARIGAWEQSWNDGRRIPDEALTFLVKPHSLRDGLTWAQIRELAVDGGYGLIILDTFSSLAPDADETKDAAIVMRRLSDLSVAISGTTVLVHHPGWSDPNRTRGGSQFEANADEVLVLTGVAEGSDLLCLTRKKVKDGPSGATMWLARRPIHGSVIIQSARPDDADVPLRDRIVAVLGGYGDIGATGPQLLEELKVPAGGRSGFYWVLRKLREDGLVGERRKRYYLSGQEPS